MLKSHAFFFVALLLVSCGKPKDSQASHRQLQTEQTEQAAELPATIRALPSAPSFKVAAKLNGFSAAQKIKLLKAAELIKKVVATKEFKTRILNHKYNGQKTFLDNMGLSNAEIYQKILEGSETLSPENNNTMDVELELYFEEANTIGYTYPNVSRIWMNTRYFNKFTPYQISDNLFHEWLHKVGFDHDSSYSPSRRYSVPYALGYLVKELAQKYKF